MPSSPDGATGKSKLRLTARFPEKARAASSPAPPFLQRAPGLALYGLKITHPPSNPGSGHVGRPPPGLPLGTTGVPTRRPGKVLGKCSGLLAGINGRHEKPRPCTRAQASVFSFTGLEPHEDTQARQTQRPPRQVLCAAAANPHVHTPT